MSSEAVLLVHSTGTGPMLWASTNPETRRGLRAVVPANLGYAPRPLVARGTVVTAEDDARAVLEALPGDVDRVHVVAHSYGGTVALHVVEALGPRAASLLVYEPVLFGALRRSVMPEDAAAEVQTFLDNPWFVEDETRGGTEPWLELFIDYWNRKGAWARLPAMMRDHQIAMGWKMFQEVRACFYDARSFADWRLPAVTTLLSGARTTAASRAMTAALAAAHPHAVHRVLPDLGHMAPLTSPAPVHAEIRRHLERAA